ncbi:DUF3284 domain-containing protein [Clostridium sp. NSJ-49]|uniref:DUF3284 domain-containing protein n=1 Tax=Clostridium sp. NSJ-49 TaxID=2763034 RepID=UPI00164B9958|nr:DUF3284 domain-containing protein [Clostridium sp. NSJ-49]MBC5626503.1 DUF3284 domain-containing protein [Clostridium sp. NSJ-49]
MSKFTVSTVIAYPLEEVFDNFIQLAKEPFNKFNEENPIGAKSKRVARKTKSGDIYMETSVTDYIKNEVYETRTMFLSSKYTGRYEFKDAGDDCTEIILTESQDLYGIMNKIGFVFQSLIAKKKIKKKLDNTINALEDKIIKERNKSENKKVK